jgi:hypothetical protein
MPDPIGEIVMSQLALRLPASLHERARKLAQQEETSLNQFVTLALAEKVAALETRQFFTERAARGNLRTLAGILDNVPDAAPMPGDTAT